MLYFFAPHINVRTPAPRSAPGPSSKIVFPSRVAVGAEIFGQMLRPQPDDFEVVRDRLVNLRVRKRAGLSVSLDAMSYFIEEKDKAPEAIVESISTATRSYHSDFSHRFLLPLNARRSTYISRGFHIPLAGNTLSKLLMLGFSHGRHRIGIADRCRFANFFAGILTLRLQEGIELKACWAQV